MTEPQITVVGSVNLDLVVTCDHLPSPGETVLGGTFDRFPGGKGANQALAAGRLGAETALIARVGCDPEADIALTLLREGGIDLSSCHATSEVNTGVALIAVGDDGENQIVVAPGANAKLSVDDLPPRLTGTVICQLEVPVATIHAAADRTSGSVILNLAPACPVPDALLAKADYLVVNETEAGFYGIDRLMASGACVVKTLGAAGASMHHRGTQIAQVDAPTIQAVDTTGAGDAFVGAFGFAISSGSSNQDALAFACAAGAAAAMQIGAQPALPVREAVVDLMDQTKRAL